MYKCVICRMLKTEYKQTKSKTYKLKTPNQQRTCLLFVFCAGLKTSQTGHREEISIDDTVGHERKLVLKTGVVTFSVGLSLRDPLRRKRVCVSERVNEQH